MLDSILNRVRNAFLVVLAAVCKWYQTRRSLRFMGQENLPQTNSCVLVCNHRSAVDPFLCGLGTKWTTNFYAWISVGETETLIRRWVFSRFGVFKVLPIVTKKPNPELPGRTQRVLDEGNVIWIAPEGTRSRKDVLLKGKPGVAWVLSRLNDVAIVPVAIYGKKPGGMLKETFMPTPTTVAFGKPFKLNRKNLDKEPRTRATLNGITDEIMLRIAALLPPDRRGEYDSDTLAVGKYTYQE